MTALDTPIDNSSPECHAAKRVRRYATLAVVGLFVVGSAACGRDEGASSTTPTTRSPDAALAEYSRCMKAQGVDVPTGPSVNDNGADDPTKDPAFKAADEACKHHLRGIVSEDQTSNTIPNDTQNAMLKYARCMRDNGVEMPDPSSSGLVGRMGDTDVDPSSPAYKSAHGKCKQHLADLPVEGQSNA